MTRELDVEIARLDGCNPIENANPEDGTAYCGCMGAPHDDERGWLLSYSTDLNALMELIRRRWPETKVELWKTLAQVVDYGESADEVRVVRGRGDTDAERLAHAVKQALEAEHE